MPLEVPLSRRRSNAVGPPGSSPEPPPSVLLEKRIEFLTELLREHQERAPAGLIEDALTVSRDHLVNGGWGDHFLGSRWSSPRAKLKILLASSRRVSGSADGHNTFRHARTAAIRRCARSDVALASWRLGCLLGLMVFGKSLQTTKGAPLLDILAT
jgi:hypothetical protein